MASLFSTVAQDSPGAVAAAPLVLEFVDPLAIAIHADILDFITRYSDSEDNADGAIRPRPEGHYRQAFASGLVVRGHRGGRTSFVQMVYLLPGTQRPYVELGTVINQDGQHGLMEPVVRAVIARVMSTWPTAHVYAIAKPGTASAHVLHKVGMHGQRPPTELVGLRQRIDLPFPAGKQVFAIGLTH